MSHQLNGDGAFVFSTQLPEKPAAADLMLPQNVTNHELWKNFRMHIHSTQDVEASSVVVAKAPKAVSSAV